MGKDYDLLVTPQNTPHFREKRVIFLVAMGLAAINFIVFSVLFPELRHMMLIAVAWIVGFAPIQYFDRRKAVWTWWYCGTHVIGIFLLTALLILYLNIYWYYAILTAEVMGCIVVACVLLRRNHRKRK